MKKVVIILLLSISFWANAQNAMQKEAVEKLSERYNKNDFEKIFMSFSEEMKNAHSKKYYLSFLSKLKRDYGELLFLTLTDYDEKPDKSRGIYDGSFEKGKLTVKVAVNNRNEIIGLYFLEVPKLP